MASILNPYLSFRGTARQAMEFYQGVFGGELTVNTFGEFGQSGPDADKVMHARLSTPAGYTIMGSDTPEQMEYSPGSTMSISLSGTDSEELRGYWDKLIDGGTVVEPLKLQMWGDEFGMCVDQFGISWMVDIGQAEG